MDESNLELVNVLTQQMGVTLNPIVDQIGRLIDSLGVQPTQTQMRHRTFRVFEEP